MGQSVEGTEDYITLCPGGTKVVVEMQVVLDNNHQLNGGFPGSKISDEKAAADRSFSAVPNSELYVETPFNYRFLGYMSRGQLMLIPFDDVLSPVTVKAGVPMPAESVFATIKKHASKESLSGD